MPGIVAGEAVVATLRLAPPLTLTFDQTHLRCPDEDIALSSIRESHAIRMAHTTQLRLYTAEGRHTVLSHPDHDAIQALVEVIQVHARRVRQRIRAEGVNPDQRTSVPRALTTLTRR